MPRDNLQPQRFELKYLVSESVALAARDFVASFLVLDENCIDKPNHSYSNHSLYLDSDNLGLYWDVINGNKNRYKLRIRFYDDDPVAPAYFEIKRRSNDAILKQRGPVRREAVSWLLAGHLPDPKHLLSDHPKYLVAVQRFCQLMLETNATPKTHVAYLREGWVSPADNSARVTFDREVCCASQFTPTISTQIENPVMPWRDLVILELKFTGLFPNWFGELVRVFGMMQCGVAKYAEGVAVLGEPHLCRDYHPPERADALEKFLQSRRSKSRTQAN